MKLNPVESIPPVPQAWSRIVITLPGSKISSQPRFVIENPPFGTPWGGKDAAEGVEQAVTDEYKRSPSRWGAGLPGSGDTQMLFLQSASVTLASSYKEDKEPFASIALIRSDVIA